MQNDARGRLCLVSAVLYANLLACALGFTCLCCAQQSAEQPGKPIDLPGKPIPPDHSKLSEHNIEWLNTQPAQVQMEFLLGAAINHDHGATDMIAKLVEDWHGKLHRTQRWQDLETNALYSNDLRVRAAAIEINLAINNLGKTEDTAKQLMESGKQQESNRPWDAWELGMLASRGIEADRIHELLTTWVHDTNQQTRFWAVEGLAHIGTVETIKDFLDVFRNDSSMDITNENLPNDPATWRNWYGGTGAERTREFRQADSWAVLGNS